DAHLRAPRRSATPSATPAEGFAIEAAGIRKTLGATVVLDGIDLAVRTGESVCIIGPNGAGKTTLLNVVAGDLAADGGTVAIFGADASSWSIHRRSAAGVGKVFQIPSVFADLSPAQNLALARAEALEPRDLPSALARFDEDDTRAASALPLADRRALELAIVLAWGPRIIVLDEPAAGLSHEESVALARLLRS